MKKNEEMRTEYSREDIGKGVRGKHYAAFQKGSNLVLLTPRIGKNLSDQRGIELGT